MSEQVWKPGDRVRVIAKNPSGFTKREWSLYGGEEGVIELISTAPKNAVPILVLLSGGRRRWFSPSELEPA